MDIPESDLPLFPLHTVLFPRMPLPLHVFEPRYHELVARCLQENSAFGVVLIKSGEEVGQAAEPYSVGTAARIVEVDQQPDGSLNLIALGVVRFRLLQTHTVHSYLSGAISRWGDEMGELREVDRLAKRAHKTYVEYLADLIELSGAEPPGGQIVAPEDPQVLSYTIAANLRVADQDKQALLEAETVQARLDQELALLERERGYLDRLKSLRAQPPGDQWGFSKN